MATQPPLIHRWDYTYSILSTVAFPHKRLLFAGTQDSKVLCFDLATYDLIKTIHLGDSVDTNTKSSVLCLTKSQDEQYLFSAGTDSLVRIWTVGHVTKDCNIPIKEVVTIYSLTDIGDIFSLRYLDSQQTVVFGSQNASMLYVQNVLDNLHGKNENDLNKLPHRRFDRFFDSTGPGASADSYSPTPTPVECNHGILEVPSKNTISYAHNGFIYSICKIQNCKGRLPTHFYPQNVSPDAKFIVSGGGDGMCKIWALSSSPNSSPLFLITELDNEESVLSQYVEFPFLYCGLSCGLVKIWDLNTNQLISTFRTPVSSDIMSISVYKDNIFVTQEHGITKFYQDSICHWNAHQGIVLSAEILNRECTGNKHVRLVTGGNDGTLALWNVTNMVQEDEMSFSTRFHTHKDGIEGIVQSEHRNPWAQYQAIQLDNDHMLQTLKELTSFQTVSQKPDTQQLIDARRCATFLQELFVKFGASAAQLLPVENGGNPVVYAHFKGCKKDKRRVLWYGHYDVISAGDSQRWKTDPFTLTCENGYLKGRGVTDNKGPLLAAIYSVAQLFQKGELANDIVFLIEGQEEFGSMGFEDIVSKHRDLIGRHMDWILFSNSYWIDENIPCLNYGLRGVVNAKITVWSDEPDRHSGVDGGVHREPTTDLIKIISRLQDDDGNVLIPEFYEPLKDLSDEEREHFEEIIQRADIDKEITVDQLVAKWTKPSLSITTMKVSGPGNVTVIPQRVSICISMRLVPEQNVKLVKKAFEDYVVNSFKRLNSKNHLKVAILNEAEPWLGDPSNEAYRVIKEEIQSAWNIDPLLVREGGSIPCVRFLERAFNAPAVQIPCGQSTDNAHLDNEQLRIKNWYKMREVLSKAFNKL